MAGALLSNGPLAAQDKSGNGLIPSCYLSFCRFGTTFLGSRAVAGALLSNGLLAAQDKSGKSLADVLSMHGFDASPTAIAKIAVPRERIRG